MSVTCSLKILHIFGRGAPALTPSQLEVVGTITHPALNPVTRKAEVSVSSNISGSMVVEAYPSHITSNQYDWRASLPITSAVKCDATKVLVHAECVADTGCYDDNSFILDCGNCPRSLLSYNISGPCSGNPPLVPVMLDAVINIPKGSSQDFCWDYGDGSPLGSTFTINNSGGSSTTPHSQSPPEPPHLYKVGIWTAELKPIPSLECPKLTVTVNANCPQSCPTITISTAIDPNCDTSGKRQVTFTAKITLPAGSQPVVLQWDWGDGQQPGASLGPAFVATSSGPFSQNHSYKPPGPYQANLIIVTPSGCPNIIQSVGPLATCPGICDGVICPSVQISKTSVGCAGNNAIEYFTSTLIWPSGTTPTVPSGFVWKVNVGGVAYQKGDIQQPAGNSVDTSAGWRDGNTGLPGPVPLTTAGTFTVTARAIINSLSDCCEPTGSENFTVDACECPKPVTVNEWNITNTAPSVGPHDYKTLTCGQATVDITLNVDIGNSFTPNQVVYKWNFHDGTPIGIHQGPTGTSQTHTFVNPDPSKDRTYTVQVTVDVNVQGTSCGAFSSYVNITVPGCTTPPETPPPETPPPPTNGKTGCFDIKWLVILGVVLFALGSAAVIFHLCFAPYSFIPLIIGIILMALYTIIMFIVWLLLRLPNICPLSWCEIVAIHAGILGVFLIIINIIASFTPCAERISLNAFGMFVGFWAVAAANCLARKLSKN